MIDSYTGKQTRIIFDGEAYQLSLFSKDKIKYSEPVYKKVEKKSSKQEETHSLFKKPSQLELKL